ARRAQHIERTLRQIAERELVRVRRELVVAKSESLTLRARLQSLIVEVNDNAACREDELQQLRSENARLASAAKRVVALKPV
ncbi:MULTISPECIES: hypothetical protein, partial [unclassified Variovorax]|uniref:hypothetical protein n=1 Tax=unclassified Variovorax TaxID=663243 RepID=UPI003F447804